MIIYKIENKINGKIYIGQTIQELYNRVKGHLNSKIHIGNALRKYGIQSFEISIIDESKDQNILCEKEKYWIKFYDCKYPNGYNHTDGGDGLFNPTEEVRIKRSKALSGRIRTLEHSSNISKALIGKKYSKERNDKISKSLIGKNKGKKRPDLSERNKSNIGKKNPKRSEMNKANIGKKNPHWKGGKIEVDCLTCGRVIQKWKCQHRKYCNRVCMHKDPNYLKQLTSKKKQ